MQPIIDISNMPMVTLPDGKEMPAIGMGTFGNDKYEPQEVSDAVYHAMELGYRFFDGAAAYGNEGEIGKVYARAFANGVVKREEVFILSKLWNNMHGKGDVLLAVAKTLKDLQLDYLDAYLMHWPFPNYHAPGAGPEDRHPDSRPFFIEEFMDTWRQMEQLVDMGLVRYIGLSNVTIPKMKEILPLCRIKPTFHEFEMHPGFQQWEMFEYCRQQGIVPLAFAPLGSGERPDRDKTAADTKVLEMPELVCIAKKYGVHPAIIALKWAMQRGHIPVPFSVREAEYRSNLESALTEPLTEEEMECIRKADRNDRLIKAQVFLWEGAPDWKCLWDLDGTIDRTGWNK